MMPRSPDAAERRAERLELVDRCTRHGETAQQIAYRAGVSRRTVERYRARLRAQTPRPVNAGEASPVAGTTKEVA